MLIIFDLDDTIIDTSGAITPFKLREALQLLIERIDDAELALLCALNESAPKTAHAIEEYGRMRSISQDKIRQAVLFLSMPLPENFVVPCTPNAKEILYYYAKKYPIALVTGGHPPFQREKLEKAGIEPSIFSKIAIPEDSVKKPFYQSLAKEFLAMPEEVWVCGDRVAMDLEPANALQFRTVHMRWGRGLKIRNEPWIDYSITQLNELRNIIP